MHFWTPVIVLAIITMASANIRLPRQTSQLPDCGTACLASAQASSTCDSTDFSCLCQDMNFISSIVTCIPEECTDTDITTSSMFIQTQCSSAGVTLPVSDFSSATATDGGASSTDTGVTDGGTSLSVPSETTSGSDIIPTTGPTDTSTDTSIDTSTDTFSDTLTDTSTDFSTVAPLPTTPITPAPTDTGVTTGVPSPTPSAPSSKAVSHGVDTLAAVLGFGLICFMM